MTLKNTTLRRQYQRRNVDLRVQLVIHDGFLTQVTPVSGRAIPGRMTDISGGGAYVVAPTFLPRAVQLDLEIPATASLPGGAVRARVMKVQMVDREPRYGVGLRFEDPDCPVVQALRAAEKSQEGNC